MRSAFVYEKPMTAKDSEAAYKAATGKDWDPLAVFADAVKALKEKPCAKPS